MKRMKSALLILAVITALTACGQSPAPASSAPNGESTVSTSEPAVSVISSAPSVSSSSSSSVSQPARGSSAASASQTSGSEATSSTSSVYITPAAKYFATNEELFNYLQTVDLREKDFDIIADEGICLTPRLVDQPKSRAAESDYKKLLIFTGNTGGYRLDWIYKDKNDKDIYKITWFTSKKVCNKQIKTPQDLKDIVKNITSTDGEIISKNGRVYLLVIDSLYWMYENKYLIHIGNYIDYSNIDELILLAEDIVFDKHKLK